MTESPYENRDAAAVYARIAQPLQFAQPARDLVQLAQVRAGEKILDVGTGTGAVAHSAIALMHGSGSVVGVDAARAMLLARHAPDYPAAAGELERLPFRGETFDAVLAGFVLTHVPDYQKALHEARRVCRRNGRMAASGWGSWPNDVARLWTDTAAAFAPRDELDKSFSALIPWERKFSEAGNLQLALEEAGFGTVRTETRQYDFHLTTGEFLLAREASVQGSLLRRALDAARWQQFRAQVTDVFNQTFGDRVEYVRDVHFAVGKKP